MIDKLLSTKGWGVLASSTLYMVLLAITLPCFAQVAGSAPTAPTYLEVKRVGDTAVLIWTAPAQYSDGMSLPSTASLSYTVYGAAPGAVWKPLATVNTLTYTTAALVKGGQCYVVTDTVAGLESLPTGAACVQGAFAANPPGAIKAQ